MNVDGSILVAARVLGCAVFALAVAGKLRYRDELVGVVANYRIVPAAWAAPAAWTVVALETFVALSLASGTALALGAAVAVTLLAGFAVAIGVNLLRGRTAIDCGCFRSALRQTLAPALVVRNLLIIAALAPLLLAAAGTGTPLSPFGIVNGLAAGAALAVLYHAFNEIEAVRQAGRALRARSS